MKGDYCFVIPCYNEEESVDELVSEVIEVLDGNDLDGEVVGVGPLVAAASAAARGASCAHTKTG